MKPNLMFFCIPQRAYICTNDCKRLRMRPVGKGPNGSQPMLKACEFCVMYPLVDSLEVPTVSIEAYLGGARPKAVDIENASTMPVFDTRTPSKG